MTYTPHSGPHAGGAIKGCAYCRDTRDDVVRRLLGAHTRSWYTSVVYGTKKRVATGPFSSPADAIADLPRMKALVAPDPRSWLYGYGICSSLDADVAVAFPVAT